MPKIDEDTLNKFVMNTLANSEKLRTAAIKGMKDFLDGYNINTVQEFRDILKQFEKTITAQLTDSSKKDISESIEAIRAIATAASPKLAKEASQQQEPVPTEDVLEDDFLAKVKRIARADDKIALEKEKRDLLISLREIEGKKDALKQDIANLEARGEALKTREKRIGALDDREKQLATREQIIASAQTDQQTFAQKLLKDKADIDRKIAAFEKRMIRPAVPLSTLLETNDQEARLADIERREAAVKAREDAVTQKETQAKQRTQPQQRSKQPSEQRPTEEEVIKSAVSILQASLTQFIKSNDTLRKTLTFTFGGANVPAQVELAQQLQTYIQKQATETSMDKQDIIEKLVNALNADRAYTINQSHKQKSLKETKEVTPSSLSTTILATLDSLQPGFSNSNQNPWKAGLDKELLSKLRVNKPK